MNEHVKPRLLCALSVTSEKREYVSSSVTRETIPALIHRCELRLRDAHTTAVEVMEIRALAEARRKYEKLISSANETQADLLRVIKLAEIRMADEVDAAQARGEIASRGNTPLMPKARG
jgi:hypothetical protein